jgi:Domain of unknown function (DUF2383)
MNETIEVLKKLQTAALGARSAYRAALKEAEARGLTSQVRDLMALHASNAAELGLLLSTTGAPSDDVGTFLSVVRQTVGGLRALFGGLDQRVLPGLIAREQRHLRAYDDALATPGLRDTAQQLLLRQHARLRANITCLRLDQERERLLASASSSH